MSGARTAGPLTRVLAGPTGTTLITVAIVVAVAVIASILVAITGVSPFDAGSSFLDGAFGSLTNFGQTVTQAVPLVLVALGWIVTTRAGRLHIGFPGQVIVGGILVAVVALHVHGLPTALHVALAMLAGAVGGAVYAAIAAWLWAKRGVQEIVSTLLLNLVAIQILAWTLRGPLGETGGDQPQTDAFPLSARWPTVPGIEGQTLSWDVLLVPLLVVAVVFVIRRTSVGFRLRLVGANPTAARYAGYSPVRVGVVAMVVSGAFAGLAGGALLLAGDTPGMTEGFQGEVGFNGIAVALLVRNSAPFAFLGAIFFAALDVGMSSVEAQHGVPSTIAAVLQGLVILLVLVAATVIKRRTAQAAAAQAPPPSPPPATTTSPDAPPASALMTTEER